MTVTGGAPSTETWTRAFGSEVPVMVGRVLFVLLPFVGAVIAMDGAVTSTVNVLLAVVILPPEPVAVAATVWAPSASGAGGTTLQPPIESAVAINVVVPSRTTVTIALGSVVPTMAGRVLLIVLLFAGVTIANGRPAMQTPVVVLHAGVAPVQAEVFETEHCTQRPELV